MASPPTKDFDYYDIGRLSENIYLVNRGSRAMATINMRRCQIENALNHIRNNGLCYWCKKTSDTHVDVYIYKYPHIRTVIKALNKHKFDEYAFQTWCEGKAFGYSEEAIADFLIINGGQKK